MSITHKVRLTLIAAIICATTAWALSVSAGNSEARFVPPKGYEMPYGPSPFAPSNAKTTTGQLISQNDFIPAKRCAKCHESTHAEWKESAHRNAFREPFYQANVNHLIRDRGIVPTRHCESCHNPVALFSGALSKKAKIEPQRDRDRWLRLWIVSHKPSVRINVVVFFSAILQFQIPGLKQPGAENRQRLRR